jgi:transcriptional regulator with XRE-family HTH domain
MAHKFEELRQRMSPEARARAKKLADEDRKAMALAELREACDLTQEAVAETLGVKQAAISKLESRDDVRLSTLDAFVEALGGRLRLTAVFPEGEVTIKRRAS